MTLESREAVRLELDRLERREKLDTTIGRVHFPIDRGFVDDAYLMVAYLARNAGHNWDRALALPLRELSRRFDATVELIKREREAAERG